jgi:hypothetical protein
MFFDIYNEDNKGVVEYFPNNDDSFSEEIKTAFEKFLNYFI